MFKRVAGKILIVGFVACLSASSYAASQSYHPLKNWWDSYALQEVVDTIQISSLEFGWYFDMEEIERPGDADLRSFNCVSDRGEKLLRMYDRATEKFLGLYPDENLPFAKARRQLKKMAQGQPYTVCSVEEKIKGHTVKKAYFLAANSKRGDLVLKVEYENLYDES